MNTIKIDQQPKMKIMKQKFTFLIALIVASTLSFGITGSGTLESPYLVSTASDLATISGSSSYWTSGIYIEQTADIDLSDYSDWTPIAPTTSPNFAATYDGKQHKITGLTCTSTGYRGVFGCVTGTIKNLGVSGSITNGTNAGILAGRNAGMIQNCYSSGTISGSTSGASGGLVGQNYSGTISNSYSTVTVSNSASATSIGGLVGFVSATSSTSAVIQNCYATGSVTQSNSGYAGGFAGYVNYASVTISSCYSTGAVSATYQGGFVGRYGSGSFSNCFFDSQTAGTSSVCGSGSPTGITAKTTTEMKTQSTFTSAGWDFATAPVWKIDGTNNSGYPYLAWQNFASAPTVTTQAVSVIGSTSATGNGNITNLGSPNPTAYGVCWNTTGTPTISDSKTNEGATSATGAFTSAITGINPNTMYYVRAYATNTAGTSYGSVESFTTASINLMQTLFWPNYENNKIEGISISGTDRVTVASVPTTMQPIAIEIDPGNEKVYWLCQTDTKIYRSNLDGTGIEVFISDPGYATTMFIDRKNGYLYWPNFEASKIERIKLDGTSRTDVVSATQPIGITVDISNGKVYWLDQSVTKIYRANIDGTGIEEFISDPGFATTLYFDQTNKKLYWPNYEAAKIERINADGTSRENVVGPSPNLQPIAITVDVTNSKIYYFDQYNSTDKIYRANLDGTGAEEFLSDPGFATTMVIPYVIPPDMPTVSTTAISTYDATSATMGGNVTADGGASVTERGVVYSSTDATPTIGESGVTKDANGTGTGTFSKSITGLSGNTTYYVCAYATNSAGTNYGIVVSFTTNVLTVTWNGTAWSPSVSTSLDNAKIDGTYNGVGFSCYDLTINAGKQVTISSGTLAVGGNLTLKSDANSTASLIGTTTVAGITFAERYLTGDKWHVVSPIAFGGSINSFLTNLANSIATKDVSSVTNYGMMDYNETTNLWKDYFTASTLENLTSGQGYSLRRTGDGVVTFTGTLFTGEKTVTLTKTGSEGWNCIGNPYTSAIGMNSSAGTASNFLGVNASSSLDQNYACVYVWDPTSSSYKIIGGLPSGLGSERSLGQSLLQSGQGFFVKAKEAGSLISFTLAMQTHSTGTALKSAEASWPGFELTASASGVKASTIVAFNNQMTKGLDPTYDAGLLRGANGLSLYTKLIDDNGVDFAIQCLPENGMESFVVPVGLDAKVGGEVKFSATTTGLPTGSSVILEDRTAKVYTDLSNGDEYAVTLTTNSSGTGRFYIHTSNLTTGTSGLLPTETFSLKAYPANEVIWIEGQVNSSAKAYLFSTGGSRLGTFNLQEGNRNSIPAGGLATGVYLLKITDGSKQFNTKIVLN